MCLHIYYIYVLTAYVYTQICTTMIYIQLWVHMWWLIHTCIYVSSYMYIRIERHTYLPIYTRSLEMLICYLDLETMFWKCLSKIYLLVALTWFELLLAVPPYRARVSF